MGIISRRTIGDYGYIIADYAGEKFIRVSRSDEELKDGEHWITTEDGHHVLLNGEGVVIAGAGGSLNGVKLSRAKSTSEEPKAKEGMRIVGGDKPISQIDVYCALKDMSVKVKDYPSGEEKIEPVLSAADSSFLVNTLNVVAASRSEFLKNQTPDGLVKFFETLYEQRSIMYGEFHLQYAGDDDYRNGFFKSLSELTHQDISDDDYRKARDIMYDVTEKFGRIKDFFLKDSAWYNELTEKEQDELGERFFYNRVEGFKALPEVEQQEIVDKIAKGLLTEKLKTVTLEVPEKPHTTEYKPITGNSIEKINEVRGLMPQFKNYDKTRREVEELAYTAGGYTDKEVNEVENELQRIFNNSSYGMNITTYALTKVLNTGTFKNQFETGTSGGGKGKTALERRKASENYLAGITEETDFPVQLRPKYGLLVSKDPTAKPPKPPFGGTQYGDVVVRFKKDSLAGKVTYTDGDSLDDMLKPNYPRFSISDGRYEVYGDTERPSAAGLRTFDWCDKKFVLQALKSAKDATDLELKPSGRFYKQRYIELQYHDGVSVNDIESISFVNPRTYHEYLLWSTGEQPDEASIRRTESKQRALAKKAAKLGIPVYYEGE